MKIKAALLILAAVLMLGKLAEAGQKENDGFKDFMVDPTHSNIVFTVKHMGIFKVKGIFRKFSGHFWFSTATNEFRGGELSIEAIRVDTGDHARDIAVKGPMFLNVKKFPKIKFRISSSSKDEEGNLYVIGDLTIRGITRTMELKGQVVGSGIDLCRNKRLAVKASGTIKRQDFGISYGKLLESGVAEVGDIIKIELDVSGAEIDKHQVAHKCGDIDASRILR